MVFFWVAVVENDLPLVGVSARNELFYRMHVGLTAFIFTSGSSALKSETAKATKQTCSTFAMTHAESHDRDVTARNNETIYRASAAVVKTTSTRSKKEGRWICTRTNSKVTRKTKESNNRQKTTNLTIRAAVTASRVRSTLSRPILSPPTRRRRRHRKRDVESDVATQQSRRREREK